MRGQRPHPTKRGHKANTVTFVITWRRASIHPRTPITPPPPPNPRYNKVMFVQFAFIRILVIEMHIFLFLIFIIYLCNRRLPFR